MAVHDPARGISRSILLSRLGWLLLIAGLFLAGLLLIWADTTVFQQAFPQPAFHAPRGVGLPRPDSFSRIRVGPKQQVVELGTRGLFQFGWFVSAGLSLIVLALGTLAVFPRRVRIAVQRLEARNGAVTALAAGLAAGLLLASASLLFRSTFFLLGGIPLILATAIAFLVFGVSCFGLALGRLLSRRLGSINPLVAALAGTLLICDLALVPYLGWVMVPILGLAGLGLAAVTRLGSSNGWSLEELNW